MFAEVRLPRWRGVWRGAPSAPASAAGEAAGRRPRRGRCGAAGSPSGAATAPASSAGPAASAGTLLPRPRGRPRRVVAALSGAGAFSPGFTAAGASVAACCGSAGDAAGRRPRLRGVAASAFSVFLASCAAALSVAARRGARLRGRGASLPSALGEASAGWLFCWLVAGFSEDKTGGKSCSEVMQFLVWAAMRGCPEKICEPGARQRGQSPRAGTTRKSAPPVSPASIRCF